MRLNFKREIASYQPLTKVRNGFKGIRTAIAECVHRVMIEFMKFRNTQTQTSIDWCICIDFVWQLIVLVYVIFILTLMPSNKFHLYRFFLSPPNNTIFLCKNSYYISSGEWIFRFSCQTNNGVCFGWLELGRLTYGQKYFWRKRLITAAAENPFS